MRTALVLRHGQQLPESTALMERLCSSIWQPSDALKTINKLDSWALFLPDAFSLHRCPAGYTAAIVFTMIVMMLFNVQQDIELPFDMDGLVSHITGLLAGLETPYLVYLKHNASYGCCVHYTMLSHTFPCLLVCRMTFSLMLGMKSRTMC
jgi:hypothetical protein